MELRKNDPVEVKMPDGAWIAATVIRKNQSSLTVKLDTAYGAYKIGDQICVGPGEYRKPKRNS